MVRHVVTVGEASVFVRCAEARLPSSDETGLRLYRALSQLFRCLSTVAMTRRCIMLAGDDDGAMLLLLL